MTKAKLALALSALSTLLINSAAKAQDGPTPSKDVVVQDALIHTRTAVNPEMGEPAGPGSDIASDALSEMMELAGILTEDLPPPPGRSIGPAIAVNPPLGAVASAPPGMAPPPPFEGHMGMGMGGPPGMGGMCPMGGGGHRGGHKKHCNPLAMLDGANALSDDQYEKLYAIKGHFIEQVVPKGVNMYMLTRHMKDLLTASTIDSKEVKDTEKQIASLASDLSMTCMNNIVDAAQVLTPEQRKTIHMGMIKRAVGGGGWRHHHHDGPKKD